MKSVLGSPFGTRGALSRTLCSRLWKCSRKRLRISFPVIRGGISLGRLAGSAFVRHPVVPPAEQPEVGQLVRSAVRPMLDVMGVAPCRGHVATDPPAALVAGDQSPPRRSWDHSRRSVWLAVDDQRKAAVARDAARSLGRDDVRPFE